MNKEELELEKLTIELNLLKRPWYLKPAILISVLSLSFAVLQTYVAEIKIGIANSKEERAVEVIEENVETADFLEAKTGGVKAKERALIELEQELETKKFELSAIEKELSAKGIELLRKKVEPAPAEPLIPKSTGYIMDVWAYGVQDSVVQKIRSYLIEQGNDVGYGGLLNRRPSWLALESTVFYYQKGSKAIAQTFADELEDETGITFDVKWGAGLGVDEGEKGKTFFVHVVK